MAKTAYSISTWWILTSFDGRVFYDLGGPNYETSHKGQVSRIPYSLSSGGPWRFFALLCHNAVVLGCPECTALKAECIQRINAFVQLSGKRQQESCPELDPAVREAQTAIKKAWNDLSQHEQSHAPAQMAS